MILRRFLIPVTPHRITCVTLSLGFIISKTITAYHQQSVTITIDWIFAVVVGIMWVAVPRVLLSSERNSCRSVCRLWWVGLYEFVNPPVWKWWLHTDYSVGLMRIIVGCKCMNVNIQHWAYFLSQYCRSRTRLAFSSCTVLTAILKGILNLGAGPWLISLSVCVWPWWVELRSLKSQLIEFIRYLLYLIGRLPYGETIMAIATRYS